jgi:hypothetical protein
LRWATPKENENDKVSHGKTNRGERCATHKLKSSDLEKIRGLSGAVSQKMISEMYGVCQSEISKIITGKRWRYE